MSFADCLDDFANERENILMMTLIKTCVEHYM